MSYSALPLLSLDASKMTQVVVNLVNNAVEHSYPGSQVEIRGLRLVSKTGGKSGEWHRPQPSVEAPSRGRRPGDRMAGRVGKRKPAG